MIITRYILLYLSALATLVMAPVLIFSREDSSLILFIAFVFFVINTFYIFMSAPSVTTSEFLKKASYLFASASLELKYQSEEARFREAEAEERRLSEFEHNQRKLQVAKDILQNFAIKPFLDRTEDARARLIAHQMRSKNGGTALPIPVGAEGFGSLDEHEPVAKRATPVVSVSAVPPTTILN